MKDKIVKLEDFNNNSLDNLVELYRHGYILEGTESSNIDTDNINTLQQQNYIPSIGVLGAVFIGGLTIGALIMLTVRK